MARPSRKVIGVAFCVLAAAIVGAGAIAMRAERGAHTDNAYLRGDVTAMAPKVSGYVTSVEVEDNQAVKAGDVLFRIHDADYRARLAQAQANLDAAFARIRTIDAEIKLQNALIRQAKAQRTANDAELDLTTKASDRRRQLVARGFVSQALVDESEAARTRAAAGVSAATASLDAQEERILVLAVQREAAIAAVSQAQAALDLAQIDLDYTVVRAPVAGVVGNRQVRVGRLAAPGVALLDIVPSRGLWVVANFKETEVGNIRAGQRARIRVDGYPDQSFEGVVDSFAPGSGSSFSLLPADNATGNFVRVVQRVPVKIIFTDDRLAGRLVPGLSARVNIEPGRRS